MKKNFLLILSIFAIISANINSQEYYEGGYEFAFGEHQIANGLTLNVTPTGYFIEYEIPPFYEDTVIVNNNVFSVINFENDDDFFEMDYKGLPCLPFKSLNLQIPLNIRFIEPIINYAVFEEYEIYNLEYPYLPAQDFERNQDNYNLQIDTIFYESDEWYGFVNGGAELSSVYNYNGSAGITVNLYPIAYNPTSNSIRIPSRIIVELPNLPLNLLTPCKHSLFDTYWHNYYADDRRVFKGNLAIFTHSDYEIALYPYMEYKRNCGYNVDLYTNENNWSDPTILRNKIKEIYDEDNEQGLDYVLIVGSPTQIPYSTGNTTENNNIPTDIYYACLEEQDIEVEPLTPDILVGRWPATNQQDVVNIIEKTIRFEELVGQTYERAGKVALFSGIDNYARWFAKDINIFSNILENYNFCTETYDGRAFSNNETFNLLNEELENNLWMMIYSGHGSPNRILLTPEYLEYYDIRFLPYSDISPISFFFACLTNSSYHNYLSTNKTIAMQWILEQNRGGVASFGATTTTKTYPDRHSGKTIFKQLKRRGRNMHLADWTQSSMQRYCNAYWRATHAENQFKRYVLMGDPTLYIYGTDWNYNPCYAPKQQDENNKKTKIQNLNFEIFPTIANNNITINTSENIEYLHITNLNGEIICRFENITNNTTISVSSLPESLYLIVAQTKDGNILNEKIIVKH